LKLEIHKHMVCRHVLSMYNVTGRMGTREDVKERMNWWN